MPINDGGRVPRFPRRGTETPDISGLRDFRRPQWIARGYYSVAEDARYPVVIRYDDDDDYD